MPLWYQLFRGSLLLLQAELGTYVFAYSLKKRPDFWQRLILGTMAGVVLLHLFRISLFSVNDDRVNSAGRILSSMLTYFTLTLICWRSFDESFWTALFVASSGFIAQDMGGTLKTLLRLLPGANAFFSGSLGTLLLDAVAYQLLYLLLFFAFRPFTRDREENFGNRVKTIFSSLVLLLCLGMARITQGNPERNELSVLAESLSQLLLDIFVLLLQFGVMERAKLSRSVDTMRELVHQQYEQLSQSRECVELVNEKYHDLKGLLESFQGNEISPQQLEKLREKLGTYDTFVDTGNRVLDVVLAEKRGSCNRRGIDLTALVDGKALSFMEELDLYALVGNALNNAIDAVSQLPEGERFIHMTASGGDGMVSLHVENPYTGELRMENRLPQSQRDARYHGFGMKSMERIVEKYGGVLSVTPRDGLFCLDVLLATE